MSIRDLTEMTEQASKLRTELEQIDALLSRINEKWNELPTIDDVREYRKECNIEPQLTTAVEAWADMPDIDAVIEYSQAIAACTPQA
jgi:hypothetical protein